MTPSPKSTILYYKNDAINSDKVYALSLTSIAGGKWGVTYAYGRRGGTLRSDVKTKEPVDYDTASEIYHRVLREKLSEGYTPLRAALDRTQAEKTATTKTKKQRFIDPRNELLSFEMEPLRNIEI